MNEMPKMADAIPLEDGDEVVAVISGSPAAILITRKGRVLALMPAMLGTLEIRSLKLRIAT